MVKSLLLLVVLISGIAHAQCDFPVADFKIDEYQPTGISKSEYHDVMDQIEAKYQKIFENAGMHFQLHRSWSDGTVNAQAWRSGSTCHIEMFGGFARYPGITPRAMGLVALHEIGHCLGGAPRYTGSSLSVEGQADYYATNIGCPSWGVGCKAAGLALATALARLVGDKAPWRPGPKLDDSSRTIQSHPPAQCRLNTYDAGRLNEPRPRCWYKPPWKIVSE